MRARRFAGISGLAWGLALSLFCNGCGTAGSSSFSTRAPVRNAQYEYDLCLGAERVWFNPAKAADLQRLARAAATKALAEKKQAKVSRLRSSERKYRRGLEQVQRLAQATLECSDPRERMALTASLLETVAAVNNSQRPPVPPKVDFFEMPVALFSDLHRPVGHGETPAANLPPTIQLDLSRLDPLPSTFWKCPADISAQDLYSGFGRAHRLELEDKLCDYSGPKDSFGMNPGFEVNCEGTEIKLKFAELFSEPLTTRIFAAVGFHADPTDQARAVRVRYDRRIFQQFHSRQALTTRFTALEFIPFYTMNLQKHYDPFQFIACAILRDGHRWTGRELKANLFRDSVRRHPEDDPANFRPEIESRIDCVITVPANIQPKDPLIKTIGSWDYGQLDHPDRRELRGAGLLAAWLGFFDTRFDNNHLRTVQRGDRVELVHYFSDLGGGLGETAGLLFSHGERPNAFPWTFTRPPIAQGPGHLARPLRLFGYKPIAPNPAFAAMTIDDARWMARLICQITEPQIVQALVASGCDSATVRLYTEKLLSRRDRMVIDLGLTNEIQLARPGGVNRNFSYDPVTDGPVVIEVAGGGKIEAPVGKHRIVEGKLVASPRVNEAGSGPGVAGSRRSISAVKNPADAEDFDFH